MDKSEKIIRSTDYDALSCRISAAKKGYLKDQFLTNITNGLGIFLKHENKLSHKRVLNNIVNSNKLPVINRGTYIRTKSIDLILEQFLQKFHNEQVQILNLGAGSDTRCFKILQKHAKVKIVELDFKDSVKLKHATIASDEILSKIVGLNYSKIEDYDEFYGNLEADLVSPNYELLSIDLRKIDQFKNILSQIDSSKPTLIISECMLCYAESKTANELLKEIRSYFDKGALIVYDPIGGEGNFGNVMVENLKLRSIQMPSLLEFNTLEKYRQRLVDLGFPDIKIQEMFTIINTWIDNDEKRRISKLEFLDEIEELKLLLEHYCLILSHWGFDWDSLPLSF